MVFVRQTPEFEIWPALYEKAYAEFVNLRNLDISGATKGISPGPYDPDTGLFQKGNHYLTLRDLSGFLPSEDPKNSANRSTEYKTWNLANNPYQGKTAYDVLKLCNNGSNCIYWPTLASTYATDSGPQSSAFSGNWPLNPVLAPSHSYPILGRYEDLTSTDPTKKYYIVMRNPWGLSIKKDPAPEISKNSLAKGIWKPDSNIELLNLDLGDNLYGIFGLENSAFEKYFEEFGWAQFNSDEYGKPYRESNRDNSSLLFYLLPLISSPGIIGCRNQNPDLVLSRSYLC